ncbi:hypothetical protein AB0A81_23875 [Streptomyces flaveolus]|uniref:Bulb-type lectin domain-containing protein n=1 Tax=Streptomyces flaveolus TaxID=67297 RepID=A0ABV1VNK8_9ACTN
MPSQHVPLSSSPDESATTATDTAPRILRAVALPHRRGGSLNAPQAGGPAAPARAAASPAPPRSAPATAPAPRLGLTENPAGTTDTPTALSPGGPGSWEEPDGSAAGPQPAGTAVVGAGATAPSESASGTASRGGHRPLLVAAAVAGAFLTAVPFVHGKHDTVNYEGLANGATPVASQSSDAQGGGLEGGTSTLPLTDPLDGPVPSVAPQVSPDRQPDVTTSAAPKTQDAPRRPTSSGDSRGPHAKSGASAASGRGSELPAAIGAAPSSRAGDRSANGGHTAATALKAATTAAGTRPDGADTAHPKTVQAATGDSSSTSSSASTSRPAATSKHAPTTTAGTAAPATLRTTAASTQPQTQTTAAKPAEKQWSTRVVRATTVLTPGASIASDRTRLTMRADGNLVISDEDGVTRWSSHTTGRGVRAVFQADGHLVVYTADDQTAWSSGTAGNNGAELVLQADGNVTILSAGGAVLWAAGTQH